MIEPRLRKRELFSLLRYAPHAGQLLVHRSKARCRTLACGTRWGKSTCAAMEIVAGLMEPREATLGWLVAPSYELTRRVMDRVTVALQEHLAHRVQAIVPREQRVRIVNFAGGISELRGKSADQPAGLLGEALDFLVVDEAMQLREEIWTGYLSPRLVDRRGWSLLLGTPAGPGWFHQQFRRGQRNRDPESESWAMPTWSNPHIDRATIEAERERLPERAFRETYAAEFLDVEGEPCERCGGPRTDVPDDVTLPEGARHEDAPTCPECGMLVDENGTCIVRWHNVWRASVYLHGERESALYAWDSPKADGHWV